MSTFLPYGRHVIDDDDVDEVVAVLRGDWLTTGPGIARFEASFSEACAAPFAVSCSSATAGLHMASLAMDLRQGAVVVPALTFLATASAPQLVGAEIIFADVDPNTGPLTPDTVRRALDTYRDRAFKAIFPVHLAGRVCEMEQISAIATVEGAAVIEDACHALGGAYSDRAGNRHVVGACAHSDMAVFSFHPVKTVAAGEGGAVTTRDADLANKLVLVRNHGMTRDPHTWNNADLAFDADGQPNPWYYEMGAPAPNYRLSDINTALALSQMRKLDDFVAKRAALAEIYDRLLAPLSPIILPPVRQPGVEQGWHLYAVRIDFDALGHSRAAVMHRLKELGIGSQVHYIPVPFQPYWAERGWQREDFPGAATYYTQTLSLPLFPAMGEEDVTRVVAALAALVR